MKSSGPERDSGTLLQVRDLTTRLETSRGNFNAVDHVSFSIEAKGTLGLVGESGSGKTMTGLSIMRLIPQPPARIVAGKVLWKGKNLTELSRDEMRAVRGPHISMIFQEPMTSLDPVFTVEQQIIEAIQAHEDDSKQKAVARAKEMLERVQIPSIERVMSSYPHQLSGGMCQRVMMAMALCLRPDLLIADEPTTALDVTIEAQILELIKELQRDLGMSVLIITHNLGLVAEICQRTAIMYAGQLVEMGPTELLLEAPQHPYTRALFLSIPRLDEEGEFLPSIPGYPPRLFGSTGGCRFGPRCDYRDGRCREEDPPWIDLTPDHSLRCWHPLQEGQDG